MDEQRRKTWLEFVSNNHQRLQNAVDEYRHNPSIMRQSMAEQGIEVTPKELNDLIELIHESLEELTNE
tara:strand:- start:609 stop:812 length:204 start_codon:yes stop_codon:yes gene_type:complete